MDIRRRAQISEISMTTSESSVTVNLNRQWQKSTSISNPNSSSLYGVYESFSNKGVNSSAAAMYIDISGLNEFRFYIRSYAESSYDYVMVSQLDQKITKDSSYSDSTLIKAHTRGKSQSGTSLSSYTEVVFSNIDGEDHRITVLYRKDGSSHSYDDKGYVLFPTNYNIKFIDEEDTGNIVPFDIDNYLTIEALEDGLTATFTFSVPHNICEYCVDGDENWISLETNNTTVPINTGQTLSFRADMNSYSSTSAGSGRFSISKNCNLKGNAMSLIYADDAVNNKANRGYNVFFQLFQNCTTIIEVSDTFLPATTLSYHDYQYMFSGCTNLRKAPKLPATTLSAYCYEGMFRNCSSLEEAPALPAKSLRENSYSEMFSGCTSLIYPPTLPATSIAGACYASMFDGCINLVEAPSLPAKTLYCGTVRGCYEFMFEGCISLTQAPELPATTLAKRCYYYMFRGCTGISKAPKLNCTKLYELCYAYMFENCTGLTESPILPAATLTTSCYKYMFNGCSNLNRITMCASDISATDCLKYWVSGVSSTGTFAKLPEMTTLPSGINGIPKNWNVVDAFEPKTYYNLQITADDVTWNCTTTTIHWTCMSDGVIPGTTTPLNGIVMSGTATSPVFGQNLSETESITHEVSFEYNGLTATTTFVQSAWVACFYTVNLNNAWEKSSEISNPNISLYDGVYQSYANKGVANSGDIMYIDIMGYNNFKLYIRSYAESSCDYVMVSQLDQTLTYNTSYSNTTYVKSHTRSNQKSGTDISNYTLVEFTNIDGGSHRISIIYRKDGSVNSNADRGYVLIPKNQ